MKLLVAEAAPFMGHQMRMKYTGLSQEGVCL